jgi:PAS domain-containing protein
MTAALLLAIRKKELARQEDQLLAQVSENRLIDALESIEEGVVLYDADDRFVFCNTKYKDNLSIIRHMFVPGTSFEDILRAATKANIVTGSADDPEKYIQDRLARRRNLEPSLLHIVETGQWVLLQEYRTSDSGTLIVRTDITEIKRAEDALLESEKPFRDLAETASDWFWELDQDLRFTYVSDRSIARQRGGLLRTTLARPERRLSTKQPLMK